MIGFIFLIIVGSWFYFVRFIVNKFTRNIQLYSNRVSVRFVIILILFSIPFFDEIIAKYQFEYLCEKYSKIWIDEDVKGKSVYLLNDEIVEIKGTFVHVIRQPWRYADSTTNKVLIKYSTLQAGEGVFVRFFSSTSGPLLFNGSCSPDEYHNIKQKFLQFGIHQDQP